MLRRCWWFFVVILLVLLAEYGKCGRYGGGSRSSGSRGGGYSRPSTSYSRPSYPSPSYSRPSYPSPSYSRPSYPSPSYSRPSHPSPSPSTHIGWNVPSPSTASRPSPSSGSSNIGWNVPSSNSRPSGSGLGSSNIGWNTPSNTNSRPSGSGSGSSNIGWNANTHNSGTSIHRETAKPVQGVPQPPPSVGGPSKPNIGWNVNSNHGPSTNTHVSTNNAPKPNPSNIGWNVNNNNQRPSTQTHIPSNTANRPGSSNVGWNTHNSPATQTHVSGSNTHKTTSTNIGWNLPPRPGKPMGPPVHSSTSHSSNTHSTSHQTVYGGKTKVKVYNTVHNHYPGSYGVPQPHYSYPGYYTAPTYYHYSSSDTGSGTLGFFLGYSLAKMTTPTYSHYSFYDGYRPRYDHYTVIHYDHNRDQAPKQPVTIQPNAIVGCVGDSKDICPAGTTSLCTSQGNLMCVVSAAQTVPCADNRQVNCVRSSVPCVNKTIPGCENAQANNTVISVNIPCVSTAKVYGNITYVNKTIIVNNFNGTTVTNSNNGTTNMTGVPNQNVTRVNATSSTSGIISNITANSTPYPITTTPNSESLNLTTKYPITTTPDPITITPDPITTTPGRVKRQVAGTGAAPQDFCVAIIAQPAQKRNTEGEELYNGARDLVGKFFSRVWGLN